MMGAARIVAGEVSRRTVVDERNSKAFAQTDRSMAKAAVIGKRNTLDVAGDVKVGSRHLEKGKGLYGNSKNQNAGRKALADVSNVKSNYVRKDGLDASKTKFLEGVISNKVNISTRKTFMRRLQETGSKALPDLNTFKRASKNLKASSDVQKTKNMLMNFVSDGIEARTERNPLVPIRKSLPVPKVVNCESTNNAKASANTSKMGADEKGYHAKDATGKYGVSRLHNSRSSLWKNRVSDGFITMGRATLNATSSSNKSTKVQPTVKTSKPKSKPFPHKPPSSADLASKTTEDASTSVLPEDSTSISASDVDQRLPPDGAKSEDAEVSQFIAKKRSSRRKSYTSSLLEKSKLIKECGEVVEQQMLPSIDNQCNQLEVFEYVDDIYEYYWFTEAQYAFLENYMSIQTDITPHMRAILINWLIEVHSKFDLMPETIYLTVTLLDQYLSQVTIQKKELQLVGLTALLLASKYEDFWHPRVKDLISISAESYSRDQMLEMEKLILRKLKFRLNSPTLYVFMLRFLKAAKADKKVEYLAFYLIELSLVEYEALSFKPSLLCSSAVYIARCTLQMTPTWTPLLHKHARYEVSQLRDCAQMILRLQKCAKEGQLDVTYQKYLRPELGAVAAIKPLDRIPG